MSQTRTRVPRPGAIDRAVAARPATPALTVGPVDDAFEREADRVAERVTAAAGSLLAVPVFHGGAAGGGRQVVQRQLVESEDGEAAAEAAEEAVGELQRAVAAGAAAPPVAPDALAAQPAPPGVAAGIARARSGGAPLAAPVRAAMEGAIGADFSHVRVHADGEADRLSRAVAAEAFTLGPDVFFRAGAYQPESRAGRHLLAHELTHVVQQGEGAPPVMQRREGDSAHPIPMRWFKPQSRYPDANEDGFNYDLTQGFDYNHRRQVLTHRVDQGNLVRRNRVLKYAGDEADERGNGVPTTRRRLENASANTLAFLQGLTKLISKRQVLDQLMEIDHVTDLQWGGEDSPDNLWPLSAQRNVLGNASQNQYVRRQSGKYQRVRDFKPGTYFKVKEVVDPLVDRVENYTDLDRFRDHPDNDPGPRPARGGRRRARSASPPSSRSASPLRSESESESDS